MLLIKFIAKNYKLIWYSSILIVCITSITHSNELSLRHKWNYDKKYYNLSNTLHSDDAILVIAYNRPRHFKEVILSLSKTPEARYLPFVFVLDGGPKATQRENIEIINNATAIKYRYIVARNINFGCGRSILDARRFMFEWCKFKRIILLEDDLKINPEYITLTFNLHNWAKQKYDNVGAVSCFNRSRISYDEENELLNDVHSREECFWGYCIDAQVYNEIKDILNNYEEKILLHVKKNNGKDIAQWMENIFYNTKTIIKERNFPSDTEYEPLCKKYIEKLRRIQDLRNEQDRQTRLAFFKKGYLKIHTVMSRACYIGHNDYELRPQGPNRCLQWRQFPSDIQRTNFREYTGRKRFS